MLETEVMRQMGDQIREALAAIATRQIGEDVYLKLENVLDATKSILYPEGLKTTEQYNRLMAISKAGCKAIGYGCQEVELLPPVVSFSERGIYLKKLPIICDEVYANHLNELVLSDYCYLRIPVVAIKRDKLAPRLVSQHLKQAWSSLSESEQKHLRQRGDKVAQKLGYEVRAFDDPPWLAGQMLYTKPMTPNWDAWREAVSQSVNSRAYPKISGVYEAGLNAAFDSRVSQDPEQIISDQNWRDLFDELGFIYDKEQNQLTPKPLNLPDNAQEALMTAISGLCTYNHPKIGSFLIKDDLVQAVKGVLEISKGRLDHLIAEGLIGRVLIKLGYQLTTRWLNRYEFQEAKTSPPAEFGAEVFSPAIVVSREMETPAFASGFRIHSPVLLRDEHTLVYMELLGPRQAVKANWAALRQRNRSHYLFGRLEVNKEDKLTTLKTTLPCGWDHWCLIHRQASYDKLTPNETFYLIDHNQKPSGPPKTFIAFLSKSLPIPILPQWAEYLWIEGRMKELITPLSEGCYGYGGWKVLTSQWSQIVGEGLAEGHISF